MREAVQIALSVDVYEAATKIAALDHVDVSTLIEDLVRRHAAHINDVAERDVTSSRIDLDRYEMLRDDGESEDDYQSRLNLFR